jgi:hypothetical protein
MATMPFNFACDKDYGFLPDPNAHQRVGYVTAFAGLGLPHALSADLTVTNPLTGAKTPAFGVIETFEWEGGTGDPLKIEMYVSQENATQLKALQQSALTTTKVSALDYQIIDYDQETKQWFTQSAPEKQPLSGIVAGKENSGLNVDLTPVPVIEGIDLNVFKVSVQITPAANQAYALTFANSSAKPVTKQWGLVVGTLAGAEGAS